MEFNCERCGTVLDLDTEIPMIEWDNGDPDTTFCGDECLYAWMAAHNASWKNPRAQVDV